MNAIIAAACSLLLKDFPFVFFGVTVVVQFIIVKMFFPETKGASLEELQHQLGVE